MNKLTVMTLALLLASCGGSPKDATIPSVPTASSISLDWQFYGTIPQYGSGYAQDGYRDPADPLGPTVMIYGGRLHPQGGNDAIGSHLWSIGKHLFKDMGDIGINRDYVKGYIIGSDFHILGGRDNYVAQSTHFVIDLRTNAVSSKADMAHARIGFAIGHDNEGVAIVAGGYAPDLVIANPLSTTMLDSVERYIPSADRWEALPPLPFGPTSDLVGFIRDNYFYVLGGLYFASSAATEFERSYRDEMWRLNLNSLSWEFVTKVPMLASGYGAAQYKNHLIIGGGHNINTGYNSQCWSYNFDTNLWTQQNPLPEPVNGISMTIMDNDAWIIGGEHLNFDTSWKSNDVLHATITEKE